MSRDAFAEMIEDQKELFDKRGDRRTFGNRRGSFERGGLDREFMKRKRY